jgi:hypothetical protein
MFLLLQGVWNSDKRSLRFILQTHRDWSEEESLSKEVNEKQ